MKSSEFLHNLEQVNLLAGQYVDSKDADSCCPLSAQLTHDVREFIRSDMNKGGGPTELNVLNLIHVATGIDIGKLEAFICEYDETANCYEAQGRADSDTLYDLALRVATKWGLIE